MPSIKLKRGKPKKRPFKGAILKLTRRKPKKKEEEPKRRRRRKKPMNPNKIV